MIDKLPIRIAGANLSSSDLSADLGRHLIRTFGKDELYHFEPPEGGSYKAAIDWTLIAKVADILGIAAFLWAAYAKVVRPRRKRKDDQQGLYIAVDPEKGLHWFLGKEIDDREVFIEEFTAKVTSYVTTTRAGDVSERIVSEVRHSKLWVNKKPDHDA